MKLLTGKQMKSIEISDDSSDSLLKLHELGYDIVPYLLGVLNKIYPKPKTLVFHNLKHGTSTLKSFSVGNKSFFFEQVSKDKYAIWLA